MNREEAEYYLQSSGFSEEQIDTIEKAFTSTDAISRQAVQDYIAKYLSQYLYNDVREAVEVIDEYIGELPSVTPQPCGDAIDRNLVCAFIAGLISDDGEREKGLEYIRSMPPVNPTKTGHWVGVDGDPSHLKDGLTTESVWCSECGKWLTASDEYSCFGKFCPNCGARMVEPQESEDKG